MVFGWLGKETRTFFIERPASAASALVYLHGDKSIPRGAKLTVRSDECALFFREGRFVGRLDAGSHLLDTANVPFLGHLLVDRFTDAAHFITEIFFVTLAESMLELPATMLGQYLDLNSRNVVQVHGKASYTLVVKDPLRIVTQLGGQSSDSASNTVLVLNGRLLNGLRRIVGQLAEKVPVLSVVSNAQAEAVSEGLIRFAGAEFESIGMELKRVLSLEMSLDADSLKLLRDFGTQEASLRLQSKGAEIASQEGFAEFNLIQGQRAALEGLGKGLAEGKGAMFMPMGLGADLTAGRGSSHSSPRSSGRSSQGMHSSNFAAPRNFLIQTERGEDGPYSVRQVALVVATGGRELRDVQIRGEDDPPGAYFSADLEPQIVAEYRRRVPADRGRSREEGSRASAGTGAGNAPNPAFAAAFDAAAADGRIEAGEFAMLLSLALNLGLAPDAAAAKALIAQWAAAKGINID